MLQGHPRVVAENARMLQGHPRVVAEVQMFDLFAATAKP